MSRLPRGVVTAVLAVALAAAAPVAHANTITTVAGGGSATPLDYNSSSFGDPLSLSIPGPTGIAWSGAASGMFYVVTPSTCVQLWNEPNSSSNSYGMEIEGGAWNDCSPQTSGYPSGTNANAVKLKNPCCVTSDLQWDENQATATVGPLVASSDSGHVDFYSWSQNKGRTIAGSSPPADCGASSLTPVAVVAPTSANFCNVTALAQEFGSPWNYAIAERNRGTRSNLLYVVDKGLDGNVHYISDGTSGGPTAFAALAYDSSNRLIVSDGKSSVWQFVPQGGGSYVAGLVAGASGADPAFSGDGGTAANARFANPKGLATGFDGAVYIADTDNCRIRRLSQLAYTATVSTVAGNGCSAGAPLGDGGPSTDASLDHPVGVAMAPTGLLITDTGHNRVRLIDRTSIINPPAFTADSTPSFDIRSLDSPAHLKCKVDNVDTDCAGIGPLLDGQHTLTAWENGNAASPPDPPDPTPAVATFTVDTTAPAGVDQQTPAVDATGVPLDTSFSWSAGGDGGAGVDHYELWIDGAKSRDVAPSACAGGSCSAKAAQPLAEGAHTWQVLAVDKVGNSAATGTRSLNAGAAPSAAFIVSPNPALVGRSVVFDASGSSDDSGIARYEWDLDGDGAFETDGGTSPTTSRTYQAATLTVRLRVTDVTGKQSTTAQTLKITQPGSAASLLGISINSGAQYTNDPNVKLLVKAPATATSVLVSNDGGFLAPATFPVSSSIAWKLDSSGPERLPKTVYVRFLLGPIVSETYTDDIILDQIPPVVQSASLSAPAAANAASAAALRTYTINVRAKDSNSGVGKVQLTANKRKPGKLIAYKSKLKLKAASRPKFIRAQDRAGNLSAWKKLR